MYVPRVVGYEPPAPPTPQVRAFPASTARHKLIVRIEDEDVDDLKLGFPKH
jgi:hypothetical protein